MSDDPRYGFLAANTVGRLQMVRDPSYQEPLTKLLGDAGYQELRSLADRVDLGDHLSLSHPVNLIFIPGVMGSLLTSRAKGGVWWIDVRNRDKIDQLRLASDGASDADPNNSVIPFTTDPSYEPFLSASLARDDFGHELFAYDWRKSLRRSAGRLRDLVNRIYEENGGLPVHLVAHSMGGLMVRSTLLAHGEELWPKLGRIVFIGTPHYGSPAIAGYLKNHLWGFDLMAILGAFLSRETYRSLWGVLELLPAPAGIYPGTRPGDPQPWTSNDPTDSYLHPCANFDMYQVEAWKLGLPASQAAGLQQALDSAARFHRDLYESHCALPQELRDRMLVVAGVGYQTLFRLAYGPQFFGLWEHTAKVTKRVPGAPHRDGDSRVTLASACLEDVPIRYVRGIHGGLPNMPEVYRDVFRWLKEEPLGLPDTTEGALSQHLAPDQGGSDAPHLDGTARALPFSDDPGVWETAPPDPQRLSKLKSAVEAEQVPEFTRLRLL